jgi:neutral trehalase
MLRTTTSTLLLLIISLTFSFTTFASDPRAVPEYDPIQQRLASGWNTWHNRSVLTHVLLPNGFSINLAFKQHYWLDEKYLSEALVGRWGNDVETIRPGLHTLDGSYTELEMRWEEVAVRVQSAHTGDDLVILVTLLDMPVNRAKLIVESGMLWNRPGILERVGNELAANTGTQQIRVFTTVEQVENDPYVPVNTPYLMLSLDQDIGISTGQRRSLEEIQRIVLEQKNQIQQLAAEYGELADAWLAVQSGLAWNLIYEPKFERVVNTVGRGWNVEYGGFCLFGWDNFFLAYVSSLFDRDLAIANLLEHLHGATEAGFIPNDNRGNDSKSFDRSQPPVGGIMTRELLKRYPEQWLLEAAFEPLLKWNNWWAENRINEGLLSYGSSVAPNPYHEPSVHTRRTAGYESGMDDSPMYIDVEFSEEKSTLELQDVGLTSLYIADCHALAEMADLLERDQDAESLRDRASRFATAMEDLWDKEIGLYLNRNTVTGELSSRLSPTLFYPLLAEIVTDSRADQMIQNHLLNPDEFYGEWMIPSIARNDETFERQRYWKGAIWPPLNFLTYLSLERYDLPESSSLIADRSLTIFMNEWKRMGYIGENYSSITGTADDERLSSDPLHSWGTLLGIMAFIEAGYMSDTGE